MVLDLYSKRKKRAEMAGKTEPYKYDIMPKSFRIQVIHIWEEVFDKIYGKYDRYQYSLQKSARMTSVINMQEAGWYGNVKEKFWWYIYDGLAKEYGKPQTNNPFEDLKAFFLDESTHIDNLLDVIEHTFSFISQNANMINNNIDFTQKKNIINNAIQELNTRFEENSLGYELNNFQIIEKNSKFVHKEIVKRSLELLHEVGFTGASNEFLNGHSHYRKGEYKEAINYALKSFESTMKTICEKKGWDYKKAYGASQLIDIMFEKELIPNFMRSHFNNLVQTLKDGLPTVRNKVSGHGQGEAITNVPCSLAQYALNLAATNIVFLVESYKDYDSSKIKANPKPYS